MKYIVVFLLSIVNSYAQDKYKIVRVEWIDIVVTDSGWKSTNEIDTWIETELNTAYHVGFLYKETPDYIVLIDCYIDEYNHGTAHKIPKGVIKKIDILVPPP